MKTGIKRQRKILIPRQTPEDPSTLFPDGTIARRFAWQAQTVSTDDTTINASYWYPW
jgi:hypothetical protein